MTVRRPHGMGRQALAARGRDEEGLLYIVDRKKDMIVSGGSTYFPARSQDVIASHPSVSAAAAIGVPYRTCATPQGAVVARPGADLDTDEPAAKVSRQRKGPGTRAKSTE